MTPQINLNGPHILQLTNQKFVRAEPKNVQELVAMYQTKQLGMKKEKGNAAGNAGITNQPVKKLYSVGVHQVHTENL